MAKARQRRTVTKQEVKERVRRLYDESDGETIWVSDAARRLELPDMDVLEAALELEREGALQVDPDPDLG